MEPEEKLLYETDAKKAKANPYKSLARRRVIRLFGLFLSFSLCASRVVLGLPQFMWLCILLCVHFRSAEKKLQISAISFCSLSLPPSSAGCCCWSLVCYSRLRFLLSRVCYTKLLSSERCWTTFAPFFAFLFSFGWLSALIEFEARVRRRRHRDLVDDSSNMPNLSVSSQSFSYAPEALLFRLKNSLVYSSCQSLTTLDVLIVAFKRVKLTVKL